MANYNGSITLASVDDGALYRVDTDYEDICRSIDNGIINYSPSVLIFKIYKKDTIQICEQNTSGTVTTGYKFDVSILYTHPEIHVEANNIYDFITHLTGTNPFSLSTNRDILSFNINNFMDLTSTNYEYKNRIEQMQSLVSSSDIYFVLSILDPSSDVGRPDTYKILTKHIFSVANCVTSSLASFSTTANSINMAVRNTTMNFTSEGLTIDNGNFIIKDKDHNEIFSYKKDGEVLHVKGDGEFTGNIYAEDGYFKGDITGAKGVFSDTINVGGNSVFGGTLDAAGGTFRGTLTAATGSFSGAITANSGEIGGFRIGATSLYSKIPYFETEDNSPQSGKQYYYKNEDQYILFTGDFFESGVTYYEGATSITSKLVLDSNTPSITLGNLNFNGDTSTISGTSFSITPDLANFKNINISGKISASVFENNKTQAVGGSMVFKPSYKIDYSKEGNKIVIKENITNILDTNQYVVIIDEDGDVIESVKHVRPSEVTYSVQEKETTVTFTGNPFTGDILPRTLIVLGQDNDIIIGINSYNSTGNNAGLLLAQGLTIREYNHLDTLGNNKPNLFLGNLAANREIIGNSVSGYGLYSDNVVLNGSLTTIVQNVSQQNPTYAGVNTLSPVQATKFDNDNSNVVFWAGAKSIDSTDIAGDPEDLSEHPGAPFQVTEKGSLYASQGIFEGAIITRSEIRGADIYAARIHGTGQSAGLGLSFYNTNKGIAFFGGEYFETEDTVYNKEKVYYILINDNYEEANITSFSQGVTYYELSEKFNIGSNGLKTNSEGNYFIEIDNNSNVDFTGNNFHGNSFISTNLIQGTKLIASDSNGTNTIIGNKITNNNNSYIQFDNSMNFNVKGSQISQLQIEQNRGFFNTKDLITQQNFQIGNNTDAAMRFIQVSYTVNNEVINGYDLFIA